MKFRWRSTTGPEYHPWPSITFSHPDDQIGDLFVNLAAFLHQAGDLLHRVDHRRVITTTELTGDRGIGEIGQLPEHVHRHLPGNDQGSSPGGTTEFIDRKTEGFGGRVQDLLGGDS